MRWAKAHKRLLIIGIIILLLMTSMIASYLNQGKGLRAFSFIGNAINAVDGPVSTIGNGLFDGVFGFFNSGAISKENEALKNEVAELNRKVISLQLGAAELAELSDLKNALNYKGITNDYSYISCDVASLDNSNLFNLFTINIGLEEGVQEGAAVLNGDGLIGRVFSVGDHSAKVMSVIDENNSVSFRVFRDVKLLGVLSGNGKGGLNGYMLDAGATVIEGDVLITSGLGDYPAGIEIGKVTEAYWENDQLLKAITIEPNVRFKSLQKVMVVVQKP